MWGGISFTVRVAAAGPEIDHCADCLRGFLLDGAKREAEDL